MAEGPVERFEKIETEIVVPIAKVDDEERNFFGWAHVQKRADGEPVVDSSGDAIRTPEALALMENAVYGYVQKYGTGDIVHRDFGETSLIESVYFTPEKREQMGISKGEIPEYGWWLGFHLPEPDSDAKSDPFDKVKSGEYGALSMVGAGRRRVA